MIEYDVGINSSYVFFIRLRYLTIFKESFHPSSPRSKKVAISERCKGNFVRYFRESNGDKKPSCSIINE